MTLDELMDFSDKSGFLYMPPETAGGLPGLSVLLPSGTAAWTVVTDGLTSREKTNRVGHEVGHCATGSFYTRLAAPTTREKCEETARRWQYRNQIPLSDIVHALHAGYRESWQIADYLDVPEPLLIGAVAYYRATITEKMG